MWLSPDRMSISIHAPVKGATDFQAGQVRLLHISIHAPVKGATTSISSASILRTNFNPRSREGSDLTRALSRSADYYFNPRSREGSDQWGLVQQLDRMISIHAPVKGATGPLGWRCRWWSYFNPRSREGSDPGEAPGEHAHQISIHAPVKGATWPPMVSCTRMVFQSTLP